MPGRYKVESVSSAMCWTTNDGERRIPDCIELVDGSDGIGVSACMVPR